VIRIVACTTGKSGMALLLGSSGTAPEYIGIGSGSGATAVTNTGLIYHVDRQAFSGIDMSLAAHATYTSNWNSIDTSGINLKEFGVFSPASGGTTWNREGFANVEFNGTQELVIDVQFQLY